MRIKAPVIASTPFKKIKTPEALQLALDAHIKTNEFVPVDIPSDWNPDYLVFEKAGVYSTETRDVIVNVNPMPEPLERLGYKELSPFVADWAQCNVIPTWAYGVREYTKNCRLVVHRDRLESHVLSAIVHVGDVSAKPWPLDFIDHKGNHHEVFMERGDTLLYESLCLHARIQPFQGLYYRNTYFHWRPENWNPKKYTGLDVTFASWQEAIDSVKEE